MSVATTDQDAARREAQVRALEAAAAAVVTAALVARLARIAATLESGFRYALTDHARWLRVRRGVARDLRAVTPSLAAAVERTLPKAAALGARHAGGVLPAGYVPTDDELIRGVLAGIDDAVIAKLDAAAARILDRVDTVHQLAEATARIDAATGQAETSTGTAVTRAVAGGVRAVAEADGRTMTWVSERDACLHCKGMDGAVAEPGGLFHVVQEFAPRPLPWVAAGVVGPPLHGSCRCGLQVDTPGLSDALRREAQRDVAQGSSVYDSLPARLRAVDALLRLPRQRLPKSVRTRAASDRARGGFSARRTVAAAGPARKG